MTDLREPLKKGFIVKAKNIDGYEFEILDEFARGGSSVIYTACGREGTVLLKELFPVNGYCRSNGRICPADSRYRDLSESASKMNGEHNIGKLLSLKSAWVEKIGNPFESSDGNYYSVIYESRPGITLKQFLLLNETDNISFHAWIEMIHRLAWIVKDLHDEKIVHLDISPGNIRLINNNDQETLIKAVESHNGSSAPLQYGVTLIDFGCSLEIDSFNEAIKPYYSPTTSGFSAPELYVDGSGIVTAAADVFSVCACLKSCISRVGKEAYSALPITVTVKLDEILVKGLAEDPMYRFKNIDSLIKELSELLLLVDGKGINKTVIWEASKRDYVKKLHTRFKDSKSEDIFEEIWSFATCSTDDGKDRNLNVRQMMNKYKDKNCLIIGDGGMGKTTVLVSLLHDAFSDERKYDLEKSVPIFIELNKVPDDINVFAQKGNKESSFILRYIASLLMNVDYGEVSNETLVSLREEFSKSSGESEYVFLLDGLNEVSSKWIDEARNSVQGIIVEEINCILNKFNNVKFIITSRDNDGIDNRCFELISLNGLSKEKVLDWIKLHNITENIEDLKNNAALLECLCVPLFLLMYSRIKPYNADISTQGELLRAFWNEKSQNYSQYQVAHNKNTDTVCRDMSVEQHRFIVDFIIPELCYYMILEQAFEINIETAKQHIGNILAEYATETSKHKALQRAFESYKVSKGKYRHNIIDVVRSFYSIDDFEERILAEVENIGVFDFDERNSDYFYGVRHQYFRDYFAAVHMINGLRVAVELFECDEREIALRTINDLLKEAVYDANIYRLIGEYLGEHKNKPYYEDGDWHYGVPSGKCDRNLIERALDIYIGCFDGESGYGVYSLATILMEVRKDLSGCDLSGLDLRHVCFRVDTILSQQNLTADFREAVINESVFLFSNYSDDFSKVALKPNGAEIATVIGKSMIVIWDVKLKRQIKVLNEHTTNIYNICYSHNSKYFVSCSKDCIVKLWDAATYEMLSSFQAVRDPFYMSFPFMRFKKGIKMSGFSVDEKNFFVVDYDDVIRIFDTGSFAQVQIINDPDVFGFADVENSRKIRNLICVAFSTTSQSIVATSEEGLFIEWDADDGKIIYENTFSTIRFASVNPEHTRQIFVIENKIYVFNLMNHKLEKEIEYDEAINDVCFVSDDKIIVVSEGHNVICIDIKNGEQLQKIHLGYSVSFGDFANSHIALYNSKNINIYNINTMLSNFSINNYYKHGHCIAYSDNGKYFVAPTSDAMIKVFDAENNCCINQLYGHKKNVIYLKFSKNENFLISVSKDNVVKLWDVLKSQCIGSFQHDSKVFSVDIDKSGKYLLSACNEKVLLWDLKTKCCVKVFTGFRGKINDVKFDPTSKYIVVASDKYIKVIYTETKYVLRTISICEKIARSCDAKAIEFFNNNSNLMAVRFKEGIIYIFDLSTFTDLKTIEPPEYCNKQKAKMKIIGGLTSEFLFGDSSFADMIDGIFEYDNFISPKDNYIATISEESKTISVFSTSDYTLKYKINQFDRTPQFIRFSPDECLLITSDVNSRYVLVCNIETEQTYKLEEHKNNVVSAFFSDDGKRIISISNDDVIKIHSVDTYECIDTVQLLDGYNVLNVDFRNLHNMSVLSEEKKKILKQYGAIFD